MRVFLINLDKNKDRLALVGQRLSDLEVSFERIPAVYGKTLSEAEKKKCVAPFKWWCLRGVMPRDGEVGCALSHLVAYRRLLEGGDDCCCVLEDDDQFEPTFKDQLARIESWIDPDEPQVVLLTNYSDSSSSNSWKVVASVGDSSSEGYVITRMAARAILKHNFPVCMPSDGWRFWVRRGWIKLYHAFPTVVPRTWMLPGYISDVCPLGEKMIRVSDMNVIQKILWKAQRVVGLILARIII